MPPTGPSPRPRTTAAELHAHGVQRVWLWGRGVDSSRFDPAKRSARLRAELAPGGELLVGYVGRLAVEKRVDLLAQVAALPGTRLVIVGSGPAEAAVRRALPSAVFLGQRAASSWPGSTPASMSSCTAGRTTRSARRLQEAAASGLPVVAPAAGGPLDLVRDGVTGFLVAPGDPAALAGAVARLAADPALRAAQGRAARQTVLSRSWPVLCDELIGHYQAALAAAGARRAEVPA